MTSVLIITEDYVDANMGGMGMRYWEIAHALAKSCQVTLAVPNQTSLHSEQVRLVPIDLQHWLGWLHAQKRLNPHTYRADPSFRKLIDVMPSGLQEGLPSAGQPVLKGVLPGISTGDRLILWSGGVWDWLDPLTPIRAMAMLASQYPDLKLYFMGTRHPNPNVPEMMMVEKAISLSQELGLYNKSVFLGSWVPYQEREIFG